jgi:hypothetical protein
MSGTRPTASTTMARRGDVCQRVTGHEGQVRAECIASELALLLRTEGFKQVLQAEI